MSLQTVKTETKVVLPEEIAEKNKELNNLRNELERVKKDKGITTGLVTQMQRDMSSKVSWLTHFFCVVIKCTSFACFAWHWYLSLSQRFLEDEYHLLLT